MEMAGVYGFKINDDLKVTSCEWLDEPCILGHHVLSFIARVGSAKKLKLIANRIILVRAEEIPSSETIGGYGWYADPNIDTWNSLLNWAEGDLEPYGKDLRHMVDHGRVLADDKSCNWAYVIDVDAKNVVVYLYGDIVQSIPFSAIRKNTVKKLVVEIERNENAKQTA